MSYPTRKNLVVAISPTPYANPLLMDMVPADALFFLGVDVATSNPSGVALVGKGGAGGPYTFTTLAGTAVTAGFEPAPGLTLNPDGTITGIPAAQGVYHFVAQVEDVGSNTHAASFSINVQGGLTPVVFRPTIGENGIAYRFEFIVRDLAGVTITSGFSVSVGTLPNGLALAGGSSNVVTGTPTALAVGVTQVTITVSAGGATLDIPCTFTIVDEVALTFIESIDPPNGWGGGAGTWLPSVTRGIPYVAHLSISGGVPPYSVSMSAVDPWPTEFLLSNQLLQVAGKTLDAASTTNPKLSAVTVTDALGGVDTAQRAYFIINQPNARIQPRKNGVDAPGGDGIVNFDFIEGDNVTLDMSTDGYTTHLTIHAHPPSGSLTINGVHPDSSGNWQISGMTVDSNGDLVIHSSSGGVALTMPAEFSVAGSGTSSITVTKTNESANAVWAGPASGAAAAPTFRALVAADLPANNVVRGPGCIFSNGGLALTGTLTDEIPVPYNGTITGWTIVGDTTGSASIAVSHSTYAAYDTMTSLFTATCTTAKKAQATGLSHAIAAGDILRFSGSGFASFVRCSIVLTVTP